MNNAPVNAGGPAAPPALQQDLGNWNAFTANLRPPFKIIGYAGNRFQIKEGRIATPYKGLDGKDATEMDWVLLGTAPETHCLYYATTYNSDSENSYPDFIWWKSAPFPPGVPTGKVNGRNPYQEKLRLVVSPIRFLLDGRVSYDLNDYYVTDIASQSVYGDSYTEADGKYVPFIAYIQGLAALKIPPYMVPVHVVFNKLTSTPSLRFRPTRLDANGAPVAFPIEFVNAIRQTASQPSVIRLLDPVNTQNVYNFAGAAHAQGNVAPVAQPQPYVDPVAQPPQPQPQTYVAPVAQPPQSQPQTYVAPVAQPQPLPQPQNFITLAPEGGVNDEAAKAMKKTRAAAGRASALAKAAQAKTDAPVDAQSAAPQTTSDLQNSVNNLLKMSVNPQN